MSISGPGPLESSGMYTPVGEANSPEHFSLEELDRRFGAVKIQLNSLRSDATKKETLSTEAVAERIRALSAGMNLAGVNPGEGTVKGDFLGSVQTIKDSDGTYKFELVTSNLIKKGPDGQPIVDENGKVQIDEDAVNALKRLTIAAEKIAKSKFNVDHITEEFGKVGGAFQEGLETAAVQSAQAALVAIALPVGLIVGAGQWIEKELQPLSKSLGEAFQPILEALERAVNATGEKLKQAATTIRNGLQTMENQINQYVVDPLLRPLYNATLGPVLELLNKVSGDVYKWGEENVYPKLAQAATDLAKVAAGLATITTRAATWLFVTAPVGVYKSAKARLEAAGAEISRIAYETYTSAAGKLTSAGEIIRETFENLPGQAQEAARLAYNDTVAALTKARDAIKEFGTGTDAAWQTNVQPHLNRAGQAIVDLDSALGGYGAAASQRIGDAIQATGQALYDLGLVAYSRAFGAKLTASEQNAMLTEAGELVGVVNTSIQVAIKSAEDLGLSAIEDPYIKQMLSQGWLGGIGAGPRQLLINLQNRVKDGKITPQEFQRRLAGIMKLMPTPFALAEKAPTPVAEALTAPDLYGGNTMAIMPGAAAVLAIAPSSGRREPAAIGSTATSAPPSPRRGGGVGSPSVAEGEVAAAFTLFRPSRERMPEELGRGSPLSPPFPTSGVDRGAEDGSFSDDGSDGGSSAGSTSPRTRRI